MTDKKIDPKTYKNVKDHFTCRPVNGSPLFGVIKFAKTLRLDFANGRFRWHVEKSLEDDVKPAPAFIGILKDEDTATVWVTDCACKVYADCPVQIALAKCTQLGMGCVSIERVGRAVGSIRK
jgi:hypothetical protein